MTVSLDIFSVESDEFGTFLQCRMHEHWCEPVEGADLCELVQKAVEHVHEEHVGARGERGVSEKVVRPRIAHPLIQELRRRRRAAGLSLADVAVGASVSKTIVSEWENGHHEPTLMRLAAYADAVGAVLAIAEKGDALPAADQWRVG